MSGQQHHAARVGDIVTAVPVGQKRRQTMKVTRQDGPFLHGLLVSKKSPGDFRGGATMYAYQAAVVERSEPAVATPARRGCQVQGRHCEECGAPVEFGEDDGGYSPCCGEHIAWGPGCDGLHAES